MMIIFGQRLCGRVDQVPGICYVATRFFHFYYLPLVPLSSWAIVHGTETNSGFRGQRIRINLKSILCGWGQAFLLLFGPISSLRGGYQLYLRNPTPEAQFEGSLQLILGLSCLMTWVLFLVRPIRAGRERAEQLLGLLGLESLAIEETAEF